MNGEHRKALKIVLEYVEDNNKQDKEEEVAEAANKLEVLLEVLD